jgi:tellurite resistance protein TerC
MKGVVDSRHPWRKVRQKLHLDELSPLTRRIVVGSVGFTVLLIGIAMMLLPGPAFIVIPLGLVILATEFIWARRILRKARELLSKVRSPAS